MSASPERAHFADELRGFALLGIVVVNAPFLAISTTGFTPESVAAWPDRLAALLVVAFAQAKFYLIFSFLFGYSLSFLLDRNDAGQRSRYRRRLSALALLGVVHAVGAFVGDILLLYALLGALMLVLVRWTDRRLLVFAGGVLVLWLGMLAVLAWLSFHAPAGDFDAEAANLDATLANGSFAQAALARFRFWPQAFAFIGVLNGPAVVALFALGLVAGRRAVLAHPDRYPALWRWGCRVGIGIGLPLAVLSAWLSVGPTAEVGSGKSNELLGVILGFAGAPLLSWGYLSMLARIRQAVPDCLRIFRPAGRMSLSGYLGESILLSLIFCGYGGALFGEVGAATAVLTGIGVWMVLDAFSQAWLARVRHGPFEMLLRRVASQQQAPG